MNVVKEVVNERERGQRVMCVYDLIHLVHSVH